MKEQPILSGKTFIGIDPGVNTGIAVWYSEDKALALYTKDFWFTLQLIQKMKASAKVIIEDPNQNRPTFDRGLSFQAQQKVSQNVGANKREASLIIQFCERNDIAYDAIRPSTEKWDPKTFKAITKYDKRCSQHARDAAKLVYGR